MKKNKGYTLAEMIVVLFIFLILFSTISSFILTSDKSWRSGQNKLTEQREARRGMDAMVRILRQTSLSWGVTLNTDKILFYRPIFDLNGQIAELRWVIFKTDPSDSSRLIKLEEGQPTVTLAQEVESIAFSGGCSGCNAFNCTSLAQDCPVVMMTVTTRKNAPFSLQSKVMLRNSTVALPEDIQIAVPPEGEF